MNGPMQVEEGDVFGGAVNFAARVFGAFKEPKSGLAIEPKKTSIDSELIGINN